MIRQRDINSAYPWACTLLPCLRHGRWVSRWEPTGVAVGKVRFKHPADSLIAHLPVRAKDGSISFPLEGVGWYWTPELDAAQAAGMEYHRQAPAWEYILACECQPFHFVPGFYLERKKLGKSGRGLVLKLALNSLYGKLAQSVGAAPYANPVWAGLITSLVRARLIQDYASQSNGRIAMLATDGVFYSCGGRPGETSEGVDVGEGLGQWEETWHEGLHIVQPGLYFTSTDVGKPKTRGVPMAAVAAQREDFIDTWEQFASQGGPMPVVNVPLRSFVGLRLAYARGRMETAGQWIETSKAVSYDWKTKGLPARAYQGEGVWWNLPKPGSPTLVTVPYPKLIGRNLVVDMDRLEEDDIPDWGTPMGLTRDRGWE